MRILFVSSLAPIVAPTSHPDKNCLLPAVAGAHRGIAAHRECVRVPLRAPPPASQRACSDLIPCGYGQTRTKGCGSFQIAESPPPGPARDSQVI